VARAHLGRYLQVLALVVVWIAIGFYFRVDANSYLLLGVPLTVVFQLAVARRRLSALWVRDAANGLGR
jgi:hypothetical protein